MATIGNYLGPSTSRSELSTTGNHFPTSDFGSKSGRKPLSAAARPKRCNPLMVTPVLMNDLDKTITMKRKRHVNVIFDESPPLPEEIIFFEIFARLPIKSLFQFRCVSKFCRSLTSDRLFIAAQCHRSPPTYLLSYPSSSPLYQHVFHNLNPNNHSQSEIFIEHFRDLRYDSYAKSINGLMCLLRGKQVIIRNLVTNNQFVLPYFHSHFQLGKHYVYFCYCPKKDKYKVLVATSKRNRNLNVVSTRYSIFTLARRGRSMARVGSSRALSIRAIEEYLC
ncbi:hypothetical protein BUALT_Bualt05G0137300 [Buddleja alternifolia]|uniref:F-box domain-containing protein n=1 Tax=Buddleja alternifolia TaxID=168488 RepID=A0AAV6XUQ9_9LAMI|nr:hypothetical protein BUALT_Bualt05G0137300 [Buddleja alternifolia]